MTTKIN